jgi:hypothetical protein
MAETVLYRDRVVVIKKSNKVTSWVYWADDPKQVVFQIRSKWLTRKSD